MVVIMKFNSDIHHRRSIRLKGYDYTQNGMYFLTICTYQRECLFGEIINDAMIANQFGVIVHEEWIKSFQIRTETAIDEFIVMPNHLHGIVMIHGNDKKGDQPVAPTMGVKKRSIGSFVAGFKSATTKKINIKRKTPGNPVWQRNYHEHIIRNDISLQKLREYIINNPQTWKEDKLFM
jgi:putative transposase